jgi:hypothetical protein
MKNHSKDKKIENPRGSFEHPNDIGRINSSPLKKYGMHSTPGGKMRVSC